MEPNANDHVLSWDYCCCYWRKNDKNVLKWTRLPTISF